MPTKSTTQILILLCLIHSKQVHSIVYKKKKGKGGSSDSSKIIFLQKTQQKSRNVRKSWNRKLWKDGIGV